MDIYFENEQNRLGKEQNSTRRVWRTHPIQNQCYVYQNKKWAIIYCDPFYYFAIEQFSQLC